MALVTMKELLERAKSNYRGIGAFSAVLRKKVMKKI